MTQSLSARFQSLRVALLSTCALAVVGPAWAQNQPSTTSANQQIEEIVVRGISLSLQKAVEDKRAAEAIQDSVSSDDLGRLPNKNSSEAINKLPGVNITQDQGEGRYVSIRGASPNLNAITVNGQAVGTVETGSRRVPLDVIGGELLGGIEVIKAVTPDMEANAVGGLINVKTASPFDEKNAFFGRVTGQVGAQELDSFTPYAVTASTGGRFGSDETIGVAVGVSRNDRHYLTKGLYADDWATSPNASRGIPQSHKFNNYDLKRKRTGINGTVEFKPNEDALYYFRGLYTKTDETEFRYRGRNYFARVNTGLTFTADNVGNYTNMRLRSELRDQSTQRRIANYTIGGENTIDRIKLDYSAGLVDNRIYQPTRTWTFQSPDILSGSFDMTPEYFQVRPNAAQITTNVSRIGINAYSESLAFATDKGSQFKFNAKT
jgi:TonB-dependent receptor